MATMAVATARSLSFHIRATLIVGSIGALSLVFPTVAQASISVQPGSYEVPAIVVASPSGPVAVFNLRTLSELRIHLLGSKTRNLPAQRKIQGLRLKIQVSKPLKSPKGEAELLDFSPLEGQKIPTQVGNDLKPVR